MDSEVDLFLMEDFSKFELIYLPALMIEHMHKFLHFKDRKHGTPYGYFLNKVFKHFKIKSEKGFDSIVK